MATVSPDTSKTWEPYGDDAQARIQYNYISGYIRCTVCDVSQAPVDPENLDARDSWEARLAFGERHQCCAKRSDDG